MPDARDLAATLLGRFDADSLDLLRDDPVEAIPLVVPAVRVDVVEYQPGEGCSVEGLYHEPERSIVVQRAVNDRRTRFTVLHEFGHDQARHDRDVARFIANLPLAAGRRAEERIADAFAAAVLIPDAAVEDELGGRQPTAHDLVRLFHRPDVAGSREACCVRVAQHLGGSGYVAVVMEGELRFCASFGEAFRPRRGSSQAGVALFERAAANGSATDRYARLRLPDGQLTRSYAAQAVADGSYVFAVFSDATLPPWGGAWTAPRQWDGDAPEMFCAECDEVSEAWSRCDHDSSHRRCSACGWCECRGIPVKVAYRRCRACNLSKRVDLFPGDGPTCTDCL